LKLLEFGKFTHLVLVFLFAFSSYKELLEIARLALVDENWLRLWALGFGLWALGFGASALYSSDSRVRVCSLLTHHDAHEMHHDVQSNCVVDSNADYTSDGNMIRYDQYVKENIELVVQSNVSSERICMNIELEHSVAKLLVANEQLHKENEHLKQTYKELYDSIKKTRVQNKDNSDSLISQINQKSVENADLKSQIQEKVFANAALKNELRKLKGNIMDTKFAKPSILGKPVLQPLRNQSVVRQPNAFKSERPNFPKPRFASQVDVNNVLSKPVTPHYFSKVREYVLAKPHHVIAPRSSRNSQKVSYGSNDMAHNHYLEEARKKAQERNRNSKPSINDVCSHQLRPRSSTIKLRLFTSVHASLFNDKMTYVHISSGLALQRQNDGCLNDRWRLLTTLQASFLKEKKGVCFSALYLQKKRNLLVFDHSYSHDSCFFHARSVIKWINVPWIVFHMAPEHISPGLGHQLMTPGIISSGLVPQPPSPTPNVPPTKNDWDSVFCPMFDEYFNPSPSVIQPVLVAVVQEPVVSTGTHSSTRIDQDTPSTSTSQTT
ncbi:hypothetical protein Tco_0079144, partial [Tanacetum coccineum]